MAKIGYVRVLLLFIFVDKIGRIIKLTSHSFTKTLFKFFWCPPSVVINVNTRLRTRWHLKGMTHQRWDPMALWVFLHSYIISNLIFPLFMEKVCLRQFLSVRKAEWLLAANCSCHGHVYPESRKKSCKIGKRSTSHVYNLRNSDDLNLPKCRTAAAQHSFFYREVKVWNNLSNKTRTARSLRSFIKQQRLN